ncbi:MAG: hypothetical protein Q8L64_05690 [bacterium]|nr:hypothetical protein [bacterium]
MKALTRTSRLFSLVGHEAVVRKGRETEVRVLDALMERQNKLPEWFHTVYPATPDQDHKGIDYVIETHDLGKVFLQVKSSEHFARRFRFKQSRRRYNRFIAVVVILEHMDNGRIVESVIRSIEKSRSLIMAEHRKCA